jgi:hypothetical protein
VPLNKYTNNFTTPLETNSITGLSPTFGSDNPVLNIGAPEVNINGTELNVISRNINFSNGTVLIQYDLSEKFIEYSDLIENQVIEWLKKSLGKALN